MLTAWRGVTGMVVYWDLAALVNGAADYLRFLSTGGSDYPLEELKIAGVDLTKPDAVAGALKEFDNALTELENLLG